MKRRLAALLACAGLAFGQRGGPTAPPSAAALNPSVIDVVAVDAAGRPVTDLTAGDFEVAQDGRAMKITNFTWFDTRLHTAVSRGGQAEQLPALDLLPDEIGRNFVVVVDDLGLSPAGIDGVRKALTDFLRGSMSSGDRMAILRSSGGFGVRQGLTGDARKLTEAIEDIRYLGGGTSAAAAGSAYWLSMRYALDGLRDFAGRKVVVLFSENPGVSGPWDRVAAEAALAAHAAGAAVYAVHPLPRADLAAGPPGALESLVRDTGGLICADFARVLQEEQGYYAIGFQREAGEDEAAGAAARRAAGKPPVLKVRREGVSVRSRAGFLRQRPRVEFPAPVERAELLSRALASPFTGDDTRASLTALFFETSRTGPVVEAVVHFDAREFSFIHDLQDVYRGAVQMRVAAYRDDGLSTTPMEQASKVTLKPAEYRFVMENGLRVSFQLKLPGAGAWQIRALVADSASDRVGTSYRFMEVPDAGKGVLALSGLAMGMDTVAGGGTARDPRGDADVRIFRPGSVCTFQYSIFNARMGADKQSALEVRTRMFAAGRVVFDGKPERMTFGELAAGARRQITGHLKLDPKMAPGDYVLQVTVRDLVGEARTATQFTDFQVRE